MIFVPHIETDLTQACNLSCVACNHLVPLWRQHGPWQTNRIQLQKDLDILSTFVHAKAWGALGGEPLMHKDLTALLQIARGSGIADRIEVWTNGVFLPRMTNEFWRSFDVLVLSIYPEKHNEQTLGWIRRTCADKGVDLVIKDERTKPNFRTLLEPEPTDPETTRRKFKECFFRGFSRVANFGYFYTCCCAPHMPMLLQDQPYGTDGIRIDDDLTEDDIRQYLTREEPLGACTICAGRQTATPIPWSEERNPVQWIAASKGLN